MLKEEMKWVENVVIEAINEFKNEIELLKSDIAELKFTIKSLSKKPDPAPVKSKAEASKQDERS